MHVLIYFFKNANAIYFKLRDFAVLGLSHQLIERLFQQLDIKDAQVAEKDEQLRAKDVQIAEKDKQIAALLNEAISNRKSDDDKSKRQRSKSLGNTKKSKSSTQMSKPNFSNDISKVTMEGDGDCNMDM
uniref:Regulator of chromosome segregation-like C-terminal domain-containing protein n=1 Tax=Panagrolaimus sp. ES5 TaxID=591445 RepID=A0AC34FST5_9BILA